MPKIVDHEERRRRLGAAACAVLNQVGAAGTTVRAVASEAGMPLATAQHYLPTRELMVRAAMGHLVDRVVSRARTLPTGGTTTGLETLRLALLELLPLDRDRLFEARVWLVLTAEGLIDDQIAEVMRDNAAALRNNLQRLVRLAQADGRVAGDLDVPLAAGGLATLLDGLTLRLLTSALTGAEATAELSAHLDRLGTHAAPGARRRAGRSVRRSRPAAADRARSRDVGPEG